MTDDLYGIADDVDELAESWDPEEQVEVPSEALNEEEEWVRRRLVALRFVLAEIKETETAFGREIERLEVECDRIIGGPSHADRKATGLHARLEALERQLTAFHAAKIAQAQAAWEARPEPEDERPKLRLPTMIRSTQGALRSGDPNRIRVVPVSDDKMPEIVAWLEDHGFGHAVTVVPEQRKIDGRVAPGLVTTAADGTPLGILNEEGEPCPHLRLERSPRWYKIDLPEDANPEPDEGE